MKIYIDNSSIMEAIEYFSCCTYNKPEQIGLYFYFKAAGINSRYFEEYGKWGTVSTNDKRRYLRNLYDLSGLFDAKIEEGLNRTSLFPFSIHKPLFSNSFYNGGSIFKSLGSRISDTLDNAMVDTLLERHKTNSSKLKFRTDSSTILLKKFLKEKPIYLKHFIAWIYRFWYIEVPDDYDEQTVTDVIMINFFKLYHITPEEFKHCFSYKSNDPIHFSGTMISGSDLRDSLDYVDLSNKPCVKQVFGGADYIPISRGVSEAEYTESLELISENHLDDDWILKILENIDRDFVHKRSEMGRKSSNILLYGVPGSGKSWIVEHEYREEGSKVERVVFHPDYTYSDFIGQILPVVESDGKIIYRFMSGPFTKILKRAEEDPRTLYILIVEEINRGNAPAIFGDVFQLLDRKKIENGDEIPLGTSLYGITNSYIAKEVYGDPEHEVRIPSNLTIIGTMNTSDQNVFTLDTAFQRRWEMRLVENSFEKVDPEFSNTMIMDTGISWKTFCTIINDLIVDNSNGLTSLEDKRLGVYFIDERDLTTYTENGEINRRFSEKVIKYLWDDAFKFTRDTIFRTQIYKTLEDVIRAFLSLKSIYRFEVFSDIVLGKFESSDR